MTRPMILDLFCGAGGAGMGYHLAGFDVVGVDLSPQPHYPFPFIQGDALLPPVRLDMFDAIHASPPCQAYSSMNNRWGSDSLPLIAATQTLLRATGLPYVIENVTGAAKHMDATLRLDGSMFDLPMPRPRLFESSHLFYPPRAARAMRSAFGIYGREGGREGGRRLWTRTDGTELRGATLEQAREAMGMPWADWDGCREAIPPAYTEHIGRQLLDAIR